MLNERSVRRTLIVSALVAAAVASLAMIVSFSLAVAQRTADERETSAYITEQHIGDDIVALTYRQQLEASRFLDGPDEARLARFRALGHQVYGQMRSYLFRRLSGDARVKVEGMKEIHETFEVVAQRVFELVKSGDVPGARRRLLDLDSRAAALDSSVTAFLAMRSAERTAMQKAQARATQVVRAGLVATTVIFFGLGVIMAGQLRRRVLAPLDELTGVTRRIREGDAYARVPSQHYTEFNAVATTFNEMADTVQLARETVEMQNEELRQSLDQLRQTQDELVQHEKLSALGQMLAGLAHELNNPLAGVLGMAELLSEELAASPDANVRNLASELALPLTHEAERARDLVRNLLSFARKPGETLGSVQLSAAVRIAAGLRASAFAQATKRLEFDVPDDLYVHAEAQKIEHVIVNLVNNALDAVVFGPGSTLYITARAIDDTAVAMTFDDDGPGFADPDIVFEPFYTTKPADRGTGLGLTLVQRFVHEFGGTVAASNRPEGGARVRLELRRAPASAIAEQTMVQLPRETGTPAAPPSGVVAPDDTKDSRARPRVLVVDDEVALREIQRRMLILEGMDVVLAVNGDEARHILASTQVDLVISDLRMPGGMDGQALHAWLAEHHPALARHMLVVTGDLHGLEPGGRLVVPEERVLVKPFTRAEYVARVRAALAAQS